MSLRGHVYEPGEWQPELRVNLDIAWARGEWPRLVQMYAGRWLVVLGERVQAAAISYNEAAFEIQARDLAGALLFYVDPANPPNWRYRTKVT